MRKFAKWGALLLVSILTLLFAARVLLHFTLTPDFVAGQLEKKFDCEASVDALELSLLKGDLVLRGLKLQPPDAADLRTFVRVETASLGVKVLPLFSRRIETTSALIQGLEVSGVLDDDGDFTAAQLFQNVDEEDEEMEKQDDRKLPKAPKRILPADENEWLAKLDETSLRDARVVAFLEDQPYRLELAKLDFTLRDIEFAPQRLETLNRITFSTAGQFQVWEGDNLELLHANFGGSAEGSLFDVETAELAPALTLALLLDEGSYLSPRAEVVQKVSRAVRKVPVLKLLERLPEEIRLDSPKTLNLFYDDDQLTLLQPLELRIRSVQLQLATQSTAHLGSGEHDITLEFAVSGRVAEAVGGALDRLPGSLRDLAADSVMQDDQTYWRLRSSGKLSDPNLSYNTQFDELKNLDDVYDELEDNFKEDPIRTLRGLFDF